MGPRNLPHQKSSDDVYDDVIIGGEIKKPHRISAAILIILSQSNYFLPTLCKFMKNQKPLPAWPQGSVVMYIIIGMEGGK